MRFTGTDADVNIATEHPEFRSWRWSSLAELADMIVPFKRDLYEAVLAEFGHLVIAAPTPATGG
jgi:putative (di)nucleoside polyphosphate hydrolase